MLKNTKRVMGRVVKQEHRLVDTARESFLGYLHGKLSRRESGRRTAEEGFKLWLMVVGELERLGRKAGEE